MNRRRFPLPRFAARHVLATYARADDAARADGMDWYLAAHREAARLCPGDVGMAAGVIAALSPQKSWPLNLAMARRAVAERAARGHTRAQCAQADRILAGEYPLIVLGGLKTRSFYRCILDPTDPMEVCIDRHAVGVALGRYAGSGADALTRVGAYAKAQDAYREAAALVGIRPLEMQAVTWVQWRAERA